MVDKSIGVTVGGEVVQGKFGSHRYALAGGDVVVEGVIGVEVGLRGHRSRVKKAAAWPWRWRWT